MTEETKYSQYVSYPMFKGLQKPLEFMGAILGFIVVYCILGFLAALMVLAVSLLAGAALIFFKQRKGLHTKKEDRGVFIYAYSTKM